MFLCETKSYLLQYRKFFVKPSKEQSSLDLNEPDDSPTRDELPSYSELSKLPVMDPKHVPLESSGLGLPRPPSNTNTDNNEYADASTIAQGHIQHFGGRLQDLSHHNAFKQQNELLKQKLRQQQGQLTNPRNQNVMPPAPAPSAYYIPSMSGMPPITAIPPVPPMQPMPPPPISDPHMKHWSNNPSHPSQPVREPSS